MADVRRLRRTRTGRSFEGTIERHSITPGSPRAVALAKAIGRLRKVDVLPVPGDEPVMLWGAEQMWAHRFAQSPKSLWLYYRRDRGGSDEFVDLVAVYDYLHEQ